MPSPSPPPSPPAVCQDFPPFPPSPPSQLFVKIPTQAAAAQYINYLNLNIGTWVTAAHSPCGSKVLLEGAPLPIVDTCTEVSRAAGWVGGE